MTDRNSQLPDDLLIDAASEVAIRQHLVQVALGREPADRLIRVGRLLDVHSRSWLDDQEIALAGRRIAWVGPAGSFAGDTRERVDRAGLVAVPGFGEVHKHIESSHLTPEYEAALVIPRGNTWTCEASHEFSNVRGAETLDFWLAARKAGSPLKIFPLPGSAVPPTAYETSGGQLSGREQAAFIQQSLMVAGLDEVMDWPAITEPANPARERLWGMIGATIAGRGVVEGHGAGLRDLAAINAFAAAGLASDHEGWTAQEVWDKLRHGIFVEIRVHSMPEIIAGLIERGLADWSQVAFATDDRSASETMRIGATDHNVRLAIRCGLAPETAIQCVTINPARHMRLTPWVGSLSPGRFADIVLLDDVPGLAIAEVWADGRLASRGPDYLGPMPRVAWPASVRNSVDIRRALAPADFAIPGAPGRTSMQAAVLRPFHWTEDFLVEELPVRDGLVQRAPERNVTKFAILDRYSGEGRLGKMFWRGCGPKAPETALGCTVAHDTHNLWITGSSDDAMALVANRMRETGGGWVLASGGRVIAEVAYEIAGLMTARPAKALDAEWQAFLAIANRLDWLYEPTFSPRWGPGFPERLQFATLTCAPWRWVLVAPNEAAPTGLVNVATGASHAIVW